MKFFVKVKEGKIPRPVSLAIGKCLEKLDGKNIIISITVGSKRSNQQNKYYWGGVIPYVKEVFEHHGDTITETNAHEFVKEHILGMVKILTLPDGTKSSIITSSANVSKEKWEENMHKIRAWGARWGVQIPMPNEKQLNEIYGE